MEKIAKPLVDFARIIHTYICRMRSVNNGNPLIMADLSTPIRLPPVCSVGKKYVDYVVGRKQSLWLSGARVHASEVREQE
jgi:hypothetical protein